MPSRNAPLQPRTVVALHGAGWGLYGVVYYLMLRPYQPFADLLWKQTLIATGTGLVISGLLGAGFWALSLHRRSLLVEGTVALTGSVAGGLLWYQIKAWGVEWVDPFIAPVTAIGFLRPGEGSVLSSAPAFPMILLAWSGLYLTLAHWQGEQRESRRRLQADAEAQRARLRMLRYQLNPHFFFNALNTIGGLADEHPERVKTAVRELSGFLRYTLLDEDSLTAPLRDEVSAVEHYLAVEKLRFEDDLWVEVDVSDAAGRQVVPAFLVLPLVENAVKHGQHTSPSPLRVYLRAALDDTLTIEVANTGHWHDEADTPDGTDTGLDNVRNRLSAQYPDQHRFDVEERDGRVHARITIDPDALEHNE